jgi:hypothetical protein
MNGQFFASFIVLVMALCGAVVIAWAVIDWIDQRFRVPLFERIRAWLSPAPAIHAEDDVMRMLRRKRGEIQACGPYSLLMSRNYNVRRKKKPTIERTVYPIRARR